MSSWGSSSSGSSSPSSGSSSGGHQSGSYGAAAFLARTRVNQQQLRYFAAAICGLMGVFILSHWLRLIFNKFGSPSRNPIRSVSRMVRNLLVRKVPGFTSSGHALVVAAYVAINFSLTFTNVQISASSIANRCGWMLTANFCLVVFLALKNTPLAILSAYSYERLNGLHQIAGYTTLLYLVLHASMYTNYFLANGRASFLQSEKIVAGIVASFGFLGVFLSAAFIRHIWYEAFYVAHIVCFMTALVAASKHQPDLAEDGVLIMFAVIAGMWGADRLVRATRVLFRAVGTHAVVEPLPNGGTKITLAGRGGRRPFGAVAGKHCFVWIPRVRLLESHPFTIASAAAGPLEFVVNAHDGFTRDLHQYAVANPGARLRASCDGPYGTFPDPMAFDKVVLIAGGSGATFTFGLAVNMLEKMGPESTKNIVFIWSVKKHDNLSWFAEHLQTLKTHANSPKVNVSLYVTKTSSSSTATTAESSDAEDARHAYATNESDEKKVLGHQVHHQTQSTTIEEKGNHDSFDVADDAEKAVITTTIQHDGTPRHGPLTPSASTSTDDLWRGGHHHHGHEVKAGRPDAATLIREAVSSTPAAGRVLVAACGPEGLMRVVRNTTASLIRGDGPGVELHCEQFGW